MPRPENILGRIEVGVLRMTAGGTGPARVPGIDPDEASSPSRQLVFEQGEERPPSLRQEGTVQPGLLPDVPSGSLPRSLGASRHGPDSQGLDEDDGLGFAHRRRGLVEKIPAHVRKRLMSPCDPELLFFEVPALRPLPVFPGELPLLPPEAVFGPFHGPDKGILRVKPGGVRERGEGDDPEIGSDLRRGSEDRFRNIPLRLDRDGPPARLPGHGGVLDLPRDLTGEAELDPSDLGKKDPGEDRSSVFVPDREVDLDLEGVRIAEGVVFSLALEAGEAFWVPPVERLPDRPVEIFEGLLLGVERAEREETELPACPPQGQELGEIPLGQEGDPGVEPSLLDVESLVPDEPDASRMAGEEALLFGGRTQAEFEGEACFHVPHSTICRPDF